MISKRSIDGLLALNTTLVYVFLYVPIAIVVLLSFNASRYVLIWKGFSLRWYAKLLSGQSIAGIDPGTVWKAFSTSVEIAVVAVAGSVVLGTLLAIGLDRYSFFGRRAVAGVVYLPVLIPPIVTGIASLLFFNYLNMYLGTRTAMLSHIMFCISFVTIMVYARLQNFDAQLEEAAYDLGASRYITFRRITLPLLMPGIVAGALLAFIFSFENYVITFFVIGNDTTLPLFFFSMIRQGVSPGVNVIATLLMIGTMATVFVAMRYQKLY